MKEDDNICGYISCCADSVEANKDKFAGDTVVDPDGSTVNIEYRCVMDIL